MEKQKAKWALIRIERLEQDIDDAREQKIPKEIYFCGIRIFSDMPMPEPRDVLKVTDKDWQEFQIWKRSQEPAWVATSKEVYDILEKHGLVKVSELDWAIMSGEDAKWTIRLTDQIYVYPYSALPYSYGRVSVENLKKTLDSLAPIVTTG